MNNTMQPSWEMVSFPGNKSDVHQDLFAYAVKNICNPNSKGFWVDIGARNFGTGFGQNNTVFLYEKGWSGLSMDIGNFGHSYSHLDPKRVVFKQMDCTNPNLLLKTFEENNVPRIVDYLSFDIDESTLPGMDALKFVIDSKGYIFNCITIEHDSYRFGTSTRDYQREFFKKLNYKLVAELDLYEDWWVHDSAYSSKFEILNDITTQVKHNSGYSSSDILNIKNTLLKLI